MIVAGAQIVAALQTISSRRTSPTEPVVVTVGSFHSGTAGNILPETAVFTGILRTMGGPARERVKEDFRSLVSGVAAAMGVSTRGFSMHPAWIIRAAPPSPSSSGWNSSFTFPARDPRLQEIFRALHRRPELGNQERHTAGLIRSVLAELDIEYTPLLGTPPPAGPPYGSRGRRRA